MGNYSPVAVRVVSCSGISNEGATGQDSRSKKQEYMRSLLPLIAALCLVVETMVPCGSGMLSTGSVFSVSRAMLSQSMMSPGVPMADGWLPALPTMHKETMVNSLCGMPITESVSMPLWDVQEWSQF